MELTEETKGSWLNRTAAAAAALLSPSIWRLPWGLNSVAVTNGLKPIIVKFCAAHSKVAETSRVSDQKNLSLDAAPLGFHKSSQRPTVCVGRAPAETDREGITSQLSIWSGTVVRRGASRPVSLSAPDGWANTRLTGLNNSSKGLASPVGFRCNDTSPSYCVRQPTWSWVKTLFVRRRRSEQFCRHSIFGQKLDLISDFKFWKTCISLLPCGIRMFEDGINEIQIFNYFLSFSGTGWNSMMWPATTGSLSSARRSRVRRSAPAGRDSPLSGPFSGPFLFRRVQHWPPIIPFSLHLYLYLSLVSSLWALIFIQYLLFIEKYIYRNQTYLLVCIFQSLIVGCLKT